MSFLARILWCLVAGLSLYTINRLQHVKFCAANFILRAPRSEHTNILFVPLHWLPIPAVIYYKHNRLAFSISFATYVLHPKSVIFQSNTAHLDLSALRKLPWDWLSQNSTANLKATAHSLAVAAKSWNSLPSDIRHSKTLDTFRCKLKTWLILSPPVPLKRFRIYTHLAEAAEPECTPVWH